MNSHQVMSDLVALKGKRAFGLTWEDKDGDESAAKEQQHVDVSSRLIDREEERMSQAAQRLSSLLLFFSFLFLATVVTRFLRSALVNIRR